MKGSERVHQVVIFGQTYALRSEDAPEYVQQVSQYVDAKFHEIAKGSPALPPAKMGILASLNIADELFRHETAAREGEAATAARVSELVALLEEGLADRPAGSSRFSVPVGVAGNNPP